VGDDSASAAHHLAAVVVVALVVGADAACLSVARNRLCGVVIHVIFSWAVFRVVP
jgi:hypothetical protein